MLFRMAVLALVLLTVSLSVANSQDGNPKPCMRAKHNNAHNVFLKRHLPDGVPSKTMDQNMWGALLRQIKTCGRPTQSFFQPHQRELVNRVCTRSGGKALSGNLCISKEPFNFVTVRLDMDEGLCGIRSVRNETKHIILGCDEVANVCQPVHFEGNPTSRVPSNNQPDCGDRSAGGSGSRVVFQHGLLIATFVVLVSILQC
ncbi:angiogenin [Salminus brasiliensis]|uniref:angiogenin n=1 Tax=Salminus brasiliensis TaxID=930266 RepID=UPI003B83A483